MNQEAFMGLYDRIQNRFYNEVLPNIKNNRQLFIKLNNNRGRTVEDWTDKELFNVCLQKLNYSAYCDNKAQEELYKSEKAKFLKVVQLIKQNDIKSAMKVLSTICFGFDYDYYAFMHGKSDINAWFESSFVKGVAPLSYAEWNELLKENNKNDLWRFLD